MAHRMKTTADPGIGRRDVLRSGGVGASALEALRADYLHRMEALAEKLRPRFESGELHGLNSEDARRCDTVLGGSDENRPAVDLLERECRRALVRTSAQAYLVLACSPSTAATFDVGCHHPVYHAMSAAAWDVIRVARTRGFYRPEEDETPTAKDYNNDRLGEPEDA